jgi:hypothetical protein
MQENQRSPASLDDIDKAMQGLLALAQHLKASDEAAVSLSRFSAASASVRQGETAAYQIKLLNQSQAHLWLGLVVDIYSRENPVHPDGHHAYFRKELFVPGRASRELAFHYNWRDLAAFVIDGIAFAPDSAWFGPCRAPAGYLVRAQLHSEEGDLVEELQLLQRLSGGAPEREIP